MPLRLPPLAALRYFEAAGRHQSFKHAATELSVTPSAVSHGISGLEQALGVELFVRHARGLSLTPTGAEYLLYVSEAFSLIAIATQRLPGDQAGHAIAVSCAPTFASRWLLPRLQALRSQWPDLAVAIDTSLRQVGFPVDGFDFAVRMSRAPTAAAAWTRLFSERLVPVCSPAYHDTLVDDAGKVDLCQATLLHVSTTREDWLSWTERTGTTGLALDAGLRFDTMQLAFDAASAGLGVAIGRRPLIDADLQRGTLVTASPHTLVAETAYWLVSAEGVERRPALMRFMQWIVREAQAEEEAGQG